MDTISSHSEKQLDVSVAEVKYLLRNKKRQELIAFYYFPVQGQIQPGPAFLINSSDEKYPVVVHNFSPIGARSSMPNPNTPIATAQVVIEVHGLDPIENAYQLVQEPRKI